MLARKMFFLISLFLLLNISYAQVENLIIKTSNENPKEGETVKLTLESDKYNLNNAKITWYIDGNEEDNGVGRKTFSVLMTNQNTVQIISASVIEEGLNDSQVQIILEISGDILLYEGYKSQVPLFYRGRSLPSKEGLLNAQLISFKDGEISTFKPNKFQNESFTWKVNGEINNELSGINKPQIIYTTEIVDNNLSLEVIKKNGSGGKISSINVPIQNTEVLLYSLSDNKLLKKLLQDTESQKKLNVLVEPFFFTVNDKYSNDLKYTWKINNIENSISTPWYITLEGGKQENVKVDLNINNKSKIIQKASRAFTFKVK